MAWVTPPILGVGTILNAATWNIVANDLKFLGAAGYATVPATQTTTSTSFTNLATVGPAVTVVTGKHAIVTVSARSHNSTAGGHYGIMGFAISGATTRTPTNTNAVWFASNLFVAYSKVCYVKTLTAGSNTFTAKYKRVTAGTPAFATRTILVEPLP